MCNIRTIKYIYYQPPSNVSIQSGASPPFACILGLHVEMDILIKSRLLNWLEINIQSSLHTKRVRISQVRTQILCLTGMLNAGSQVGNTPRQIKGKAAFKHCLFTVKSDVSAK